MHCRLFYLPFGNHVKKFGSNFNQGFSFLSKSNLKCLFVSDSSHKSRSQNWESVLLISFLKLIRRTHSQLFKNNAKMGHFQCLGAP